MRKGVLPSETSYAWWKFTSNLLKRQGVSPGVRPVCRIIFLTGTGCRQPAVSQGFQPSAGIYGSDLEGFPTFADWQSAIQQVGNLRYFSERLLKNWNGPLRVSNFVVNLIANFVDLWNPFLAQKVNKVFDEVLGLDRCLT
jgi:hypothetical protein